MNDTPRSAVKPGLALAGLGFLVLGGVLAWHSARPRVDTKSAVNEPRRDLRDPVPRSLVSFERGKYYTPTVSNDAARSFGAATAAELAEAEAMRSKIAAATSAAEIQGLLVEARSIESEAILPIVNTLLANPDADVRTLALTLIEGVNSPLLVDPISKGLNDSSVDVRIEAMEVAMQVRDPRLSEIMLQALDDNNISVRQLALQAADQLGPVTKEQAIARAATSSYPDLAAAGLALIEAQPSKKTLPLVFKGLDHRNQAVREQAHEMLFLTTHESFKSAGQAETWWKQNSNLFNDDLVVVDPEHFIRR